ncbi:TetR/AcrR family transcriptional regulator [Rhodobacteraceae bacterium R_SAG1]|jgi:AcrR family transcriptional regulator|uniref:TetR/AcrR family transcriptional regulator n=1 Tax=Phaeobacter italicus TaxID=481446 RepID=UPI000186FB99|nr:TetR/AcrR family transcriptional regulator [Phaeobacter italicus]EEB72744.1 transcriptional regulator, TetR family [Ruegeria sp. R11]MEC8015113.1 TetR/AcrR family transcriptional regulator [Pseudomonadota bacterium]NKX41147.1 TetR/AcrR family transcriptional regulator [Rhodobacteraceae bacterium R_SAG2]NKX71854.1 TetR/AcrR family transcriptional regulator [Rhodobacteraceae bacterium R_SAG1]MBY5975285.1 TetR/AcrR family transcriptional regulator [Phaeobacter italicus]
MASKAEIRKQELRDKLIVAAEVRIRRDGAGALRARDLAADAGCAVGAIYNAFDDMNAIVMAVNGRTFQALGQAVRQSLDGAEAAAPTRRLILMSNAYLAFAAENTRLWRALFDVQAEEAEVPDWYRAALDDLFSNIAAPVAEIYPDKAPEDLVLMVRALFSAVHGIVLLGLENRISGVPVDQIERMISEVLSRLT